MSEWKLVPIEPNGDIGRAERAENALADLYMAFRPWSGKTVKQEEAMRRAFAVFALLTPSPLDWPDTTP